MVIWLQRLGGLSYFAGAEKKDERVLVPDLGSLTSIHDRWVGALKMIKLFDWVLCFLYLFLGNLFRLRITGRASCSII